MANDSPAPQPQPPPPSPDLRRLDRLDGQKIKGIEIIGHERDTLTIWGGEKGSPAYHQGRFSDDGNTVGGEWVCPGGGGYHSTSTRAAR